MAKRKDPARVLNGKLLCLIRFALDWNDATERARSTNDDADKAEAFQAGKALDAYRDRIVAQYAPKERPNDNR